MRTTTDPPAATAAGLINSIWAASALVSALGRPALGEDDPAVGVLALAGLVERRDAEWVPSTALSAEVPSERTAMMRERLISTLGQAAAIAAHGPGCGWDGYSDEVLIAQGRFSAVAGRIFKTLLASIPELAAALDACPVIIDVGVGVAAGACSVCEALPGVRVIGLDVNPRALGLARQLVEAKALSDRIELRLQAVEDLRDNGVASLVHISPPFFPRPALAEGIARLFQALRPGGRLILSGIARDGTSGAIDRWQAHNAGGSAVTLADCAALVEAAGFETPMPPPNLPPGMPTAALARRP
jgi:SAM-dependent methyltransferase